MAAYNAGVKTVLIPNDNLRDLEEIDALARENLQFIPCKKASDVLKHALVALPCAQDDSQEPDSIAAQYIPMGVPANTGIRMTEK